MAEALKAAGNDWGKRLEIYSFYAALSQYNIDHYGKDFEAIEQSLLDQLQYDTADASHGLNLTLNQITGYYQGYDLANYYRGMLEGNQDYLPSFLDHFDYSQGQRQDMQDIQKPAPAPEPETIDSVMNNGGSWNSAGQAVRSDGTVCDNLPSRGDYEYSKTGRIDDYYPDGTAAIIIDGNSYPVWSAPKKQTSDNATSTETQQTNDSTSDGLLSKIQNKLSNGYQNVTQLKDDIFAYKEQKDIEYAKNQLAVQGITSADDPEYGSKLAAEYQKAKQQSDAVWGLAVGEGVGGLVDTLNALKTFKYAASTVEGASNTIQVPGRVQSRINLRNGSASEGAGWEHVVDRHFNSAKNASQFTISQGELQELLQSDTVVRTPVTKILESADGVRYVREVTLDRTIGIDKFSGEATSIMTVLTDKFGNLVTATPGVIK